MSRWIEVSVSVDGEAAEAAAELFNRYGYQGVAIEHEGIEPEKIDDGELPPPTRLTVRAYLPEDDRADEAKRQLETGLGYLNMMYPMPQPTYRIVDEQDWAEAWKAHYHPVRIGRRVLIRPLWIDVPFQPGDVEIALDPGMAFGTGTHPTTQLCLEALEDVTPQGGRVLDLGTGSGILAIGAAKLGAGQVYAIDNDPVAVKVTLENLAQNGIPSGQVVTAEGSLETVLATQPPFDLIVVNILARVIIAMCGQGLGETVRPGGYAVFSGIILEQADDVEAALRGTGLVPVRRRQQSDWVVIEATKPA
jgi:ribosomal protein L11 methyltransferase